MRLSEGARRPVAWGLVVRILVSLRMLWPTNRIHSGRTNAIIALTNRVVLETRLLHQSAAEEASYAVTVIGTITDLSAQVVSRAFDGSRSSSKSSGCYICQRVGSQLSQVPF